MLSPPGSIAVTLDGPEPLRSSRDVRLEDEQGREVIRLRQGVANMGFLGMLDGVFLAPTDSEGKTTVHGLPAGVYRLFVEGHDASARVTVEPLQTAAATLNIGEE